MKHLRSIPHILRAAGTAVLTLGLLAGLCACSVPGSAEVSAPTDAAAQTESLILDNAPAELISGVQSEEKVISLVFEGYTDATIMESVLDTLMKKQVDTVFFVSGAMATEQPEIVQKIAKNKLEIGNYGITAAKALQNNAPEKNIHQFQRTQQLISEVCHAAPKLACADDTEFTYEVLQTIAAAGPDAAVQPDLYLNHRSFANKTDAEKYAATLVPGCIISVKLGMELSQDEFGDTGRKWDEKPAIDPPPSIRKDNLQVEEDPYENITDVVQWLLEALDGQGYTVVSPRELQHFEKHILGNPAPLSEEILALTDPNQYALPVTGQPLQVRSSHAAAGEALESAVFVGDSVTGSLAMYVRRQQAQDPDYLSGVRFLTTDSLCVEKLLSSELFPSSSADSTDLLRLEDALAAMEAKTVYLMVRPDNSRGYSKELFMANYQLLAARIREKNPDIRIVFQSILPAAAGRDIFPSNRQIFHLNLMLYKMCLQYDLDFVDTAFALRDASGDLRRENCLDADTYGIHPNQSGCEAWIRFVMDHTA